jgi:NAD(P)-dependent dehydrogenase (short-subunit alcohol dehydrogenase family)
MVMLNNQVVAITGAAGRLGSAFSRAVVDNGGRVVIGDVVQKRGHQLAEELGTEMAVYFQGDLTDPEVIDEMVRVGVEKFGKLDAAVHSAYPVSSQWGTRFEDLQAKGLDEDLFHQLGGAILFSQRMIRHFREQGHGNLIHISSIQGVVAPKFDHYEGTSMVSPIEYSAIKAGVIAVARYLAKCCKGQNIRVNTISPGGILTDQPESFLEQYREDCVSKGMLDADDVTGALLFLLSEHSKYITGQNIVVDDGWIL